MHFSQAPTLSLYWWAENGTGGHVREREEADVVVPDLVEAVVGEAAEHPAAHVEHPRVTAEEAVDGGVVVDGADALAEVALRAEVGHRLGALHVVGIGQLGVAVRDLLHRVRAELTEDVAADQAGQGPTLLAGRGERLHAGR